MKLYLAHQITGLTGKEVIDYYDEISQILGANYDLLKPMTGKRHLYTDVMCKSNGYDHPVCIDHAIFERDMWMVQQADMILCDLTGTSKASIGCSMELAVAAFLKKHTVTVLPAGNIHEHCFIKEASDIILPTLTDAIEYLLELSGRRN